ncbi:ADAMTSL4 [Cordylochernes scorpioides]|uniref:ADAMTSL4 n=1 Tax=Cordylochernes scorpioides TaxID=51811 RepID=A0ABY6LGI1_9ARAC|nr:ADAMTSL4 [Cordylochernes scorpioides]
MQCSERCGAGVRTREVVCLREAGEVSAECPTETRPPTHKSCAGRYCGSEWLTSEFGACSATCGTGRQLREVACVGPNFQPASDCPEAQRPAARQPCGLQGCGGPDVKSPPKRDTRCTDKYGNCPLVVRARLCTYAYYRDLCCESCSKS